MRFQRHIIKAYPYSFGTVIVAMIVVLKFQTRGVAVVVLMIGRFYGFKLK